MGHSADSRNAFYLICIPAVIGVSVYGIMLAVIVPRALSESRLANTADVSQTNRVVVATWTHYWGKQPPVGEQEKRIRRYIDATEMAWRASQSTGGLVYPELFFDPERVIESDREIVAAMFNRNNPPGSSPEFVFARPKKWVIDRLNRP